MKNFLRNTLLIFNLKSSFMELKVNICKKLYINNKPTILIIYIFIIFIVDASFIKCCAYSQDYTIGYVSCIVNDLIPEEKVNFYIKDKELTISLLERDLEPSTKEKLIKSLERTNFFQKIHITVEKAEASLPALEVGSILKSDTSHSTFALLPEGVIYDTPIADPRWPRFSAGYARHLNKIYGKDVFNLSFGENFSLMRYKTEGWTYEPGLQASLTGLMDIGSSPTRLINSDYFIGAGLSIVYNEKWQNLIQFSHLSSHLGDELLISNPNYIRKRVNLSYEAFKWFTAYKFNFLRPYIGFGYLIDRDPSALKPFTLEGGIDYFSENKFLFNTTRYVLGVYTHLWSENNFNPSLSVRTGLQLENPIWGGRHLQFLIDYAQGKSRHGQFYKKNEQYVGFIISVSQ